jgi:hypothetical protein
MFISRPQPNRPMAISARPKQPSVTTSLRWSRSRMGPLAIVAPRFRAIFSLALCYRGGNVCNRRERAVAAAAKRLTGLEGVGRSRKFAR